MVVTSNTNYLAAKWQGISSLLVFDRVHADENISNKVMQTFRELHFNFNTNSHITRKLFNETCEVFLNLQEAVNEEKPTVALLLKTSHQYRAILQSCIEKMNDEVANGKRKANLEETKSECELLTIVELLWHLCEALYIESQSGGYCLKPLLSWVKWHFSSINSNIHEVMSSEDPFNHPSFWKVVYGLVFQGRLDEVCDMLKYHPYRDQKRFDAFANIEELMRKMPLLQVLQGESLNEFLFSWEQWSSECHTRLQEGDFTQHPEIEEIAMLLCGKESAYSKHKDLCDAWYEIMAAKLLYTNPTVTTLNLKPCAVESLEMYNGIGYTTVLDEIVLSVLSFDVHTVLEKCSEAFSNWWFVSHLSDLLYHCELLKSYNLDYGAELREFLILEYSATLMSHASMWSTAAEYLMCCPTYGRAHLVSYIEKVPLENEQKALKLIHLCNKHSLSEQSRDICKVMGMKALRRKRLGVALSWCLRSKDELFASLLTDQFLNHYAQTGTFLQCDLIDNLGSAMLLNNKLIFLGKYYEFHKLYVAERYNEASDLLVSLLTSSLAPKRFWIILLIDALPLLEHSELMFSSEQTFELMQCLAELQLCCNDTYKTKTVEEQDQVELLRLALSRNLSRSLFR